MILLSRGLREKRTLEKVVNLSFLKKDKIRLYKVIP